MINIRQVSFGVGEISEDLSARIDLSLYMSAVRTCHNFRVTKKGSLENRHGTLFVSSLDDAVKSSRLLGFDFGSDQSFVLEFDPLSITVYWHGGTVVADTVETTYTEADLPKLVFAQSRDVITITCPGKDPMELHRNGDEDWSLVACDFSALEPVFIEYVTYPGITDMYIEYTPHGVSGVARDYDYGVSMVLKEDATGRVTETQINSFSAVLSPLKVHYLVNVDNWNSGTNYTEGETARTGGTVWLCILENLNKDPTSSANSDYWEKIGTDIWDSGTTYSIGDRVRDSINQFFYRCTAGTSTGEQPSTSPSSWDLVRMSLGTHIGRLFYLPDMPVKLHWPGVTAPTGYTLVAYRLYRGEQNHYVDGVGVTHTQTDMVLLDELDPWVVDYRDDGSTPVDSTKGPRTNINPLDNDPPETVAYFGQRRAFGRRNEVILSEVGDYYNLEKPRTAVADAPTSIIVDSNQYEEIKWLMPGKTLLIGTTNVVPYVLSGKDTAQQAMTSTDFAVRGQEKIGACGVRPLQVKDKLVFLDDTARGVHAASYDYSGDGYLSEDLLLLASHLTEDDQIISWCYQRQPDSTLWAVTDSGRLLGLTYIPAQKMVAWHWHDTQGTYEDVCCVLEGSEHALYARVCRTLPGGTVRYLERFDGHVITADSPSEDLIFLDCALTYSGSPATVFSGLSHLEGMEVYGLADGNVCGPYTVSSGAINVADDFEDGVSKMLVGLAYESSIELLDALDTKVQLIGKMKQVKAVRVKIKNSRGFDASAGSDNTGAKWWSWMQRTVSDSYDSVPLASGEFRVAVGDHMNLYGRARIRQADPLPLTILAVEREIDLGDES